MKLRYCCNLITTPDFSEITNLEELDLEGCVNLVTIDPSIGMLKRIVVLNLTGCLKIGQLPKALGWIRTAITKLPSLPTLLTSVTPFAFSLLSKQQHPQRPVFSSLAGLHMLKKLNFSYCNIDQVPESIGGLSCLNELNLKGNNFTSLPGSLSQLSHLGRLSVYGCKKLEVLPELPLNVEFISASNCTSLREVLGSIKDPLRIRTIYFTNCPKLFKNVSIDNEGCILKTECVDSSSIISQGSIIHQLSAFLGYTGLQTDNKCEFFLQDTKYFESFDIIYHGNSIPEWFINRSLGENHVKVELPSEEDWCFDKLRGFGTCVVFKCKKPFDPYKDWYSVKNFDGASLILHNRIPHVIEEYLKKEEEIGIHEESYVICLCYRSFTQKWKEAKKFVTFSFFEEFNEDVEVKACGARLICEEDIHQETDLSMLQGLSTPTQHGGAMCFEGTFEYTTWSW